MSLSDTYLTRIDSRRSIYAAKDLTPSSSWHFAALHRPRKWSGGRMATLPRGAARRVLLSQRRRNGHNGRNGLLCGDRRARPSGQSTSFWHCTPASRRVARPSTHDDLARRGAPLPTVGAPRLLNHGESVWCNGMISSKGSTVSAQRHGVTVKPYAVTLRM